MNSCKVKSYSHGKKCKADNEKTLLRYLKQLIILQQSIYNVYPRSGTMIRTSIVSALLVTAVIVSVSSYPHSSLSSLSFPLVYGQRQIEDDGKLISYKFRKTESFGQLDPLTKELSFRDVQNGELQDFTIKPNNIIKNLNFSLSESIKIENSSQVKFVITDSPYTTASR